ncbi:histidine kinase [Sphingomonas sp. UNC305MFCol5.2]|uniref:histidine kinase n=1 Tax=Sphingomonas sp. UNC305MFCol5.2 TaxID=1449076 RepID=UPI000400A753|nr:sensor histidine kinase [Sphingomonas sp. UNC305MFCol5.2]
MIRLAAILLVFLLAPPVRAADFLDVRDVVLCAVPAGTPPAFTEPSCRSTTVDAIDSQDGPVWIKAIIPLPRSDRPLGLRIAAMAASEVWWNDTRLGANGRPGTDASAETPGTFDAVWPLAPTILRPGDNVLVAHLSSWHQPWRVGHPVVQIDVEEYTGPQAPLLRYYLPALATAGIFAIAAIFFGGAWFADRRNLGSLALAALSAATLAQLAAEVSRGVLALPYPWQGPRLLIIMICASGVGMSMLAYAAWHYRRDTLAAWVSGGAVAMISVWLLPIAEDARSMLVLALGASGAIAAVSTAARRRDGKGLRAGLLLAALAVFITLLALQPDFLDGAQYLTLAGLAAILFADQILVLRRAQREAASAAMRAAGLETALLRQSIAPHFLLNTLNSLVEWVESDPKAGVEMIELLGDEFRTLARIAGQPLIALDEEIGLCRAHLRLMAFRTDARLGLDVDGDTATLQIPPGILLTLVENALVHGRYADGASFSLKIVRAGPLLGLLELTTPASLRGGDGSLRTGTGLAYIGAQIAAAFGAEATVDARAVSGSIWRTTIVTGALS